eukprot:UN27893
MNHNQPKSKKNRKLDKKLTLDLKDAKIENLIDTVEDSRNKKIPLNEVHYNVVISRLMNSGKYKEILKIYDLLKTDKIKPDNGL